MALTALPPRPRTRPFPRAAVAALVGVASVYFACRGPLRVPQQSADFPSFYAATRAWARGSDPYDVKNLEAVLAAAGGKLGRPLLPPITPPATFLLLLPFGLADFPDATLLWVVFQLALLAAILLLLLRTGNWSLRERTAWGFLAMVLALSPIHLDISQGHVCLLAAFFVVLALRFDIESRDGLVGTILVLATATKPQMGFFFLLCPSCVFERVRGSGRARLGSR